MQPRHGLVDDLAARAHLPRTTVQEVLDTMAEIEAFRPVQDEIEQLIDRARHHALGLPFLLEGNVEAVAITFRTHVFRVEAARRRLSDAPAAP